jgi:cytochrome c2
MKTQRILIGFCFSACFGICFLLTASSLLESCAKQDGGKSDAAKESVKAKPEYYKVKEVKLGATIDPALSQQGGKVFDVTCTGCHKYDERYVGPALGKVLTRRTPEYVMNMILDTETMVEKDDTVRCMLQTYLMKMPNMQVDEKDARAVVEHLREVAAKK